MKAWIPLTLVLALGAAATAQADCTYPRAPDKIPDGATATETQNVGAKNVVSRYNNEMNASLDCIKLEIQAIPKDAKMSKDDKAKAEAQEKLLDQKNNAAVDELQSVATRFNEQLKIWTAKNA